MALNDSPDKPSDENSCCCDDMGMPLNLKPLQLKTKHFR